MTVRREYRSNATVVLGCVDGHEKCLRGRLCVLHRDGVEIRLTFASQRPLLRQHSASSMRKSAQTPRSAFGAGLSALVTPPHRSFSCVSNRGAMSIGWVKSTQQQEIARQIYNQ